jgi:hypothetical protein
MEVIDWLRRQVANELHPDAVDSTLSENEVSFQRQSEWPFLLMLDDSDFNRNTREEFFYDHVSNRSVT